MVQNLISSISATPGSSAADNVEIVDTGEGTAPIVVEKDGEAYTQVHHTPDEDAIENN